MRIEGLVQLKSGDAVRGAISRRAPWFAYLRVDNATAIEARTDKRSSVDGFIWVPKANVLFIQELVQVAPAEE